MTAATAIYVIASFSYRFANDCFALAQFVPSFFIPLLPSCHTVVPLLLVHISSSSQWESLNLLDGITPRNC